MKPSGPVSWTILLALVGGGFLAAPLAAQFTPRLQDLITSPTKLDVVLVTFKDAPKKKASWTYPYHKHDLPHDYSRRKSDGALIPGDDSYKMEDWQRLFGTPGAADFEGKGVTVANGREVLPEVFGSLRQYFEDVSGGRFILQVRIINPQDANGYPRWVQLPKTKGYYGELDGRKPRRQERLLERWTYPYHRHDLPRGRPGRPASQHRPCRRGAKESSECECATCWPRSSLWPLSRAT